MYGSSDGDLELDIPYEQTRTLVLECLGSSRGGQVSSVIINFQTLAKQKGLAVEKKRNGNYSVTTFGGGRSTNLPQKYERWVDDILWDLVIEGVIRPGLGDSLNKGWPWYHITEYGEHVLGEQSSQPYDPDGYLKRVIAIPAIDDTVVLYLDESLKSFRQNTLLSSTITLGCASEKAILTLIDTCRDAFTNQQEKSIFEKKTDTISIKRKHDALMKVLKDKVSTQLPYELKEDLEHYVGGLFSILRKHRNDAGHPTGKVIRREELYSYLVIFPSYLEKVYALTCWISDNEI
jgi:hypothetical protein